MTGLASCNSKTDSKDSAQEQNERRIESMAITDSSAKAKETDANSVIEIASGNMMEVELAKVAAWKATSPKIKELAKMIVKEHSNTSKEIKKLASDKNIVLPKSLINKHQELVIDVTAENGKNFDKKYMDVLLEDHKEDIEKFQVLADQGNDAELKAFASKALPVLIKHKELAEEIEKESNNK